MAIGRLFTGQNLKGSMMTTLTHSRRDAFLQSRPRRCRPTQQADILVDLARAFCQARAIMVETERAHEMEEDGERLSQDCSVYDRAAEALVDELESRGLRGVRVDRKIITMHDQLEWHGGVTDEPPYMLCVVDESDILG